MKNLLIFVGKEFGINEAFIDYVKREKLKHLLYINSIMFFSEKNKDIFLEISSAYNKYDNLLIITNHYSYPTVAKVVSTLFEDNLVAKEDILVPSKATKIASNSFLIGETKKINVLRASICDQLPQILLKDEVESINLYLFDVEMTECQQQLDLISKRTETGYTITELTPNLYKICAYNRPYGNIANFAQEIKNLYPKNTIVTHDIFEYLIERLSAVGKKITFAESCTGGLLASMLTKVPGSSTIFDGSVVTYSNAIKHAWLGVKEETLQTFGAVSEETVEEMLRGAVRVTKADYAIAISGIAGPGGATPTKPVGTVVIGAKSDEQELIRTFYFKGDRNYIQYQAAMQGIKLLLQIAGEDLL